LLATISSCRVQFDSRAAQKLFDELASPFYFQRLNEQTRHPTKSSLMMNQRTIPLGEEWHFVCSLMSRRQQRKENFELAV